MKKAGVIVIIVGVLLTVFSSISVTREEPVLEIGDYEVTQEKEEEVNWPQWAGFVTIGAGIVLLIAGRKKD